MRGHSGTAPVANSLETHKLPTFLPRLLGLLSVKDTVINSPNRHIALYSTYLPNCFHTFNCILFCRGSGGMGWDRYYYLHFDEETMVHRREGIIIVNICGTLMCQEVLFPWGFCASLPLSLVTALRSIRLSAPLRSRENFGTPRRITQLIPEGARMEVGLLALCYHALPPPYGSTTSITDKIWRLFLLMQHLFPIICEMEEKSQARFFY